MKSKFFLRTRISSIKRLCILFQEVEVYCTIDVTGLYQTLQLKQTSDMEEFEQCSIWQKKEKERDIKKNLSKTSHHNQFVCDLKVLKLNLIQTNSKPDLDLSVSTVQPSFLCSSNNVGPKNCLLQSFLIIYRIFLASHQMKYFF